MIYQRRLLQDRASDPSSDQVGITVVGLKCHLLGHLICSRTNLDSTAHRCSSGMTEASSLAYGCRGSYLGSSAHRSLWSSHRPAKRRSRDGLKVVSCPVLRTGWVCCWRTCWRTRSADHSKTRCNLGRMSRRLSVAWSLVKLLGAVLWFELGIQTRLALQRDFV